MNIQPGVRIGKIKFGVKEELLIAILGKPLSIEEGEYIENSREYYRELFYQKDLSFTFDSEDNYMLGLITIIHRGHTLFGRDLIGLLVDTVKAFISKEASEIPKYENWSYKDVFNHFSVNYNNLGLIFWFDDDVLSKIQSSYLFLKDGNTIK